jgi:hypothetical protein
MLILEVEPREIRLHRQSDGEPMSSPRILHPLNLSSAAVSCSDGIRIDLQQRALKFR